MKKAMDMQFQETKIKLVQKSHKDYTLIFNFAGELEKWRKWNLFNNIKEDECVIVVKVIRKKALESPTIYSKDFAIVEKRSDGEYDKYVLYSEFLRKMERRKRK